jgi:hypothetical protein
VVSGGAGRLRAKAEAATPGPWESVPFRYSGEEVAAGRVTADQTLACLAPDLAVLLLEAIDAVDDPKARRGLLARLDSLVPADREESSEA